MAVKQKGPTGKLRPRGRPQKIQAVENISVTPALEPKETANTSDENYKNTAEKAISATKISSKVHKLATYKEAISDPIHSQCWKKVIKEEIQNLKDHHT